MRKILGVVENESQHGSGDDDDGASDDNGSEVVPNFRNYNLAILKDGSQTLPFH